jgi:hypothetical protein
MYQPVGPSGASHLNVYTKLEGKKIPLVGNCAHTFFFEEKVRAQFPECDGTLTHCNSTSQKTSFVYKMHTKLRERRASN